VAALPIARQPPKTGIYGSLPPVMLSERGDLGNRSACRIWLSEDPNPVTDRDLPIPYGDLNRIT
jgi:hypothetical protein